MQRHASVVIFGGTSEGRELAEYAEAHHIPVLVSVVSGYGESLLRESDLVQVHTGALDEAAMRQFLLEARAGELYGLLYPDLSSAKPGAEWRTGPVVVKAL